MNNESRIIKDYNVNDPRISTDYLYNNLDWDLIECNLNLDAEELSQWFAELQERFKYLEFDFSKDYHKFNESKRKQFENEGHVGIWEGGVSGYTLAWPIERDEPLPPPSSCDPATYPEIIYDRFFDEAKIMQKFKFGYFNEIINKLGIDALRQAVIVIHHPGMIIVPHTDRIKPLKLHVPLQTDENAIFYFGENNERGYNLKVGKVYIINTGVVHSTENPTAYRAHILTRIAEERIIDLLKLRN